MGAIQFIENLDRTSLTISDEEFEKHVEIAVSKIAEKQEEVPPPLPPNKPPPSPGLQPSEKSTLSRAEVTPRNSVEGERAVVRRSPTPRNAARSDDDENPALAVLRTIQRPLSSIGRIFSDDNTSSSSPTPAPKSLETPHRPPPRDGSDEGTKKRPKISAEEAAARQESAEAKQARDISAREEKNLVETLNGMFPGLDKEVIVDVVRANEGR